jgi:signal transduction histidine kinase
MDIEWLQGQFADLPTSFKTRLEHALGVSELLIKAICRISYSISPKMLEDLGLNETLKWLCKEFSVLNGIPCHFESTYNTGWLSHEIQLDFFRICQESLSNIMYHAEATLSTISVDSAGDEIRLTIVDNGKGFDIEKSKKGTGLISMRERAASINGQLKITSDIGKGTMVCLIITQLFKNGD